MAGAFVEVNSCACKVLEMLTALSELEGATTGPVLAMTAHLELMMQRIGYVNQVAADLACPGLLDAPDWSNWMNEPTRCDYSPSGGAKPAAGAGAHVQIGGGQ